MLEQQAAAGKGGKDMLNLVNLIKLRTCNEMERTIGDDVAQISILLSFDDRFQMRAALAAGLEAKQSAAARENFVALVQNTLREAEERPGADPTLCSKLSDIIVDAQEILGGLQ